MLQLLAAGPQAQTILQPGQALLVISPIPQGINPVQTQGEIVGEELQIAVIVFFRFFEAALAPQKCS